jgi:hypothetical protein
MNLTELIFGHYFDQHLENSLSNLTNLIELSFNISFNKFIGDSLYNLKKLT